MDPKASRGSYSEGVGFEAIAFVLVTAVGLGSSIAIARLFGVEVLGEYALAFAPYYILNNLSSVREQAAFARRIAVLPARDPQITGLWAAMFGFSTALTAGMGALVLLVTWLIFSGPMGRPELFGLAVIPIVFSLLVFNPSWNLDRVFTTFRAGPILLRMRVTQALLTASMMIIAGIAWGTTLSLVLAETLSWIPLLAWRIVAVRRYMRLVVPVSVLREGASSLREIVSFGLKLTPGTLAEAALNQAGTWIIGLFSPLAALGAYSRAWQLVRRVMELRARISEMLFPTLIERRDAGDLAGADRALADTMRYVLTGLTLIAAAGGGAAVGVMEVFGEGFVVASDALVFLLLVPPLAICSFVQFQSMWALNRPTASSVISLVRAGVGLPLMAVLTWQMGIAGCALGQVIAYAAGLIVITAVTARSMTSPLQVLFTVRQAVAIPLAYGAGFVVSRLVDDQLDALLMLPVSLVAGAAAYSVVAVVVGGRSPRDRDRVRRLRARLAR
ncbi:oligosaccharide flippase family protein [Svornostia abyssi]|uniref:Oligosaccharide flippase family protein n=1 Tax=Svornostia abyssi TaxID=2898438 RepID=A0ABY5PFU9_9ACTN|nr:oligosaccharide flippase family protein [Parviterribacteraceae bacterium J379]